MATVSGTLDFLNGRTVASVAVPYATMAADTVVQVIEYTDKLEEVLVQNMILRETARTVGVGFTVSGYAPNKAIGTYAFRAIILEA
jgi:hypothetical protein